MTDPSDAQRLFSRILVVCDGTPSSPQALDVAGALAKAQDAALALVTVVDPGEAVTQVGGITAYELVESMRTQALERLHAAESHFDSAQQAREFFREGRPEAEILDVCREWQADLIVMPADVHSGLHRLLFGSTADRVVMKSPQPVLLIPSEHPAALGGGVTSRWRLWKYRS